MSINFFCFGKWNGQNEFVISGKERIVETHVFADKCTVEIVNLSSYRNPPYYNLMKADTTEEEREKSRKDWEHSLNPAIAVILRQDNQN